MMTDQERIKLLEERVILLEAEMALVKAEPVLRPDWLLKVTVSTNKTSADTVTLPMYWEELPHGYASGGPLA